MIRSSVAEKSTAACGREISGASTRDLLKEAIREYIDREESRQNFIKVAKRSYQHYKETGSHISLDEFSAWVDAVEQKPSTSMPVCHE